MQTTTNYGLKKPENNEYFDQQNHANWNMDQIDSALTPTADPALTPTGNGPGKLIQWVSWITNRIKVITGGTYWYSAPATTLAAAKAHADAAAPHTGHETPAGAQAKVDTHASDYTLQIPYAGTTTNVGNAYSIASPAIAALTAGMAVSMKINADSTGAATLNWNGKGAVPIYKANGVAVSNLKTGGVYTLRYDGTNFILQGEGASGDAVASDLLSGKKATTDAGEITGTMLNRATGDYVADGSSVAGTTLKLSIPDNAFYGDAANITVTDADFIAANIVTGKNVLGVAGSYSASKIKSVQHGLVTLAAGSTSVTAALSAVNMSKAFLIFDYYYGSNAENVDDTVIRGVITNSTLLTFDRWASNGAAYISWHVIEFTEGITVQRGTGAFSGAGTQTKTVTISAIDTTKSFIIATYKPYGPSPGADDRYLRSRIVSSTQIEIICFDVYNYTYAAYAWQVISFA